MRISSRQIFDAGVAGLQLNQQALFKLQNQLSTGRKVLTPADDPVAAAQALVVTQAKDRVGQFSENQGYAKSALGNLDAQLSSLADLIQNVRERALQGGNDTYSDEQRGFIATELQARLDELMAIANADDGTGQFVFSGFQGNVRPFAASGAAATAPALASPIAYSGDEGQRLIQVSEARQMPVNVSGADLFMNIAAGNGDFLASVGGNGGGINQGTGKIDVGAVTDPSAWRTGLNANGAYEIVFSAGGAQYSIYDDSSNLLSGPTAFTPGQTITLPGGQVTISGQPAAGDTFDVAPVKQSLFTTLQNLIGTLQTATSASFTPTERANRVAAEIANLDQSLDNLNRVRADVGTRLKELQQLGDSSADIDLQYAQTLSELQDLDYTEAISNFTQVQIQLEAAQKSFVQTSRLSLFDIL